MKSTVSIVTPSYRQGQYLERTIQSVLSQKGDFYIDYIIQDGGSQDESVEIIEKYQRLLDHNCLKIKRNGLLYYVNKDKKFKYNRCLGISYRWISQKDKGQVDAIIKGFAISQGDIINWLNSDDVFFNDQTLKTVVDLFRSNSDLDLVTADGNLIDKDDQLIGQMIIPKIDLKELIYLDYHVLQPSTFITKALYQKNKKFLNINMSCAFDALFYTKIFNAPLKYIKLKQTLSCYRIYPEIKTLALSGRRFKEQMQVTLSISRNPFLILLSYIYRYCEIVLKPKIDNQLFQSFFKQLRKFSYLIVTGKPDRDYV